MCGSSALVQLEICMHAHREGALDDPMCLPNDYHDNHSHDAHRRLAGGRMGLDASLQTMQPASSDTSCATNSALRLSLQHVTMG